MDAVSGEAARVSYYAAQGNKSATLRGISYRALRVAAAARVINYRALRVVGAARVSNYDAAR